MPKIIGIDLGTSNSAAAVMQGGSVNIVPAAEGVSIGGKAFPSYVAFTKDGQKLVGEPARRQAVSNPGRTFHGFKRRMGTDWKATVDEKTYTAPQLSAFVLQKMKQDAEQYLGESVEKAVITVPAYFDDAQRQATKDAGKIAGLDVVRIINEPTAAALAYGLDQDRKEDQHVLVFDLGGGTLDCTIMEITKEGTFEVRSTSGDTQLGGRDMDSALLTFIADTFKQQEGMDLRKDPMALQRLHEAAEKAKIELSTTMETEVNLPFISATQEGPKHLLVKVTRAKLEELVRPTVDKCRPPVVQALKDAGLDASAINRVILVGGPTRMPIVQQLVEEIVGKKIEHGVDPMECVAKGAAIQASILSGEDSSVKDILLLDVTPLTLSIETLGGVATPLITRNTTVPTSKSQVFSTAADNQTSVEVHVLQGERPMAKDNKSLGRFMLDGIPPSPRGLPQVEVTFDIDANGIITVSAKDKATNKEQKITISGSAKLSDEEIERMKRDAEAHAEEDKKQKELVELRNQAEVATSAADKAVRELGDKIEASLKADIEEKTRKVREVKDGQDAAAIKQAMDDLQPALSKIGEQMYKEAAEKEKQQKEQGGDQTKDAGGERVKDGDFSPKS
ncbi:MAG: molecular chaperone DnaK [bacterium]|nr:molecular chaperone DnaK [bacterium]